MPRLVRPFPFPLPVPPLFRYGSEKQITRARTAPKKAVGKQLPSFMATRGRLARRGAPLKTSSPHLLQMRRSRSVKRILGRGGFWLPVRGPSGGPSMKVLAVGPAMLVGGGLRLVSRLIATVAVWYAP